MQTVPKNLTHTVVSLKIIRANCYFPIFNCLLNRASETDSSDFGGENRSNLHANNEKLPNVILITV